MAESKLPDLTTGAKRLIEAAVAKRNEGKHIYLGVNHWLLALYERHAPMVESLIGQTDPAGMTKALTEKLGRGELGPALDEAVASQRAGEVALKRSKSQAAERDLAIVILQAAGFKLDESGTAFQTSGEVKPVPMFGDQPAAENQVKTKTPTLEQFGRDLTRAAREGRLMEMIGREEESQLMMETLCRRTKRNPVLIGPAGVGKTAIVEGLANLIVAGKVPAPLQGMRIISLQPSVIVAGADTRGDLEKRMQAILQEASQNNIILFIDEIHTVIGAGGITGSTDLGSLLKPALARGEVAVIAATTDDEYRRFIETDSALERRFQPIRVNELSPEQTFQVLATLREELTKKYNVQIDDDVMGWLIQFGQQYMKNRYFPDKAVDLLEQSVAHAVAHGSQTLKLEDAQDVAQRMVGMPLSLESRLESLQTVLIQQGLMGKDEVSILLDRLQVTMRGLDLRASRPNAVLLLSGSAAESSETLASTIAGALFGDSQRVVSIDMSRMLHPEDVSLLVGAPPGYVGYSDSLPLHRLAQIPWCVVRFENIDLCHPSIRAFVTQSITDGRLVDGRGKAIYFSDTLILMTANINLRVQRSLGFQLKEEKGVKPSEVFQVVADAVGEELAGQVDLFLPGVRPVAISREWLQEHLLADLSARFLKQGLSLNWDESLVNWLLESRNQFASERDWERWMDYSLSPAIVDYLPKPGGARVVTVTVKIENDSIKVEPGSN